MVVALVCAGAVAVFAALGGPREPVAAAKAATEGGAEPLVRSDPGVEPWKEEAVGFVGAETEDPDPPADPEPRPEKTPEPPDPEPDPEPEPAPAARAGETPVFEEPPEPTPERPRRSSRRLRWLCSPSRCGGARPGPRRSSLSIRPTAPIRLPRGKYSPTP